jgi:aspartyl-tRNA(Asn)/glutamyl-tRNA(Gln) amidotransferase subunit A
MVPSKPLSMYGCGGQLVALKTVTCPLRKDSRLLLRTSRLMTRPLSSETQSASDLARTEYFLANIDQHNPRINAFISWRDPENVKRDVLEAQQGPLKGRIIALKDNYCTTDQKTTCASKVLENFVSPYDATVVKLIREAGGTVIGKTNMDEFAMGSNNDQSAFGITRNPLFSQDTSTGGSSGGSAAAVAADMCDISLGTDTGGSVRLPSAYCGVIGFKPSYGMISRYGVISYAQSLDTVGILGKSVSLVEGMFDVLNKYDMHDPTCISESIRKKITARDNSRLHKPLRIGIIAEAIINLSEEVRDEWINCLDYVRSLGHEIELVSVPALKQALPVYFILSPAEASSNLARYDGVRYGTRADVDRYVSQTADTFESTLYGPTRTRGFGDEVQRRILLGTYNLNAGAYSNHFSKAQKVRRKLIQQFNDVFAAVNVFYGNEGSRDSNSPKVDCIILPTARTRAPTHEEIRNESDPIEAYVNDVLTVPANLAGLPAISVPWGQKSVGMQVWGQFGDDHLVLDVAKLLEKGNAAGK